MRAQWKYWMLQYPLKQSIDLWEQRLNSRFLQSRRNSWTIECWGNLTHPTLIKQVVVINDSCWIWRHWILLRSTDLDHTWLVWYQCDHYSWCKVHYAVESKRWRKKFHGLNDEDQEYWSMKLTRTMCRVHIALMANNKELLSRNTTLPATETISIRSSEADAD